MRRTNSKVSDKSRESTGEHLLRNNSRLIDDIYGPNLENLTASGASNLHKTDSDFQSSTKLANATFCKAAGVLAQENSSNIFGEMQQLPTSRPNPHFSNMADRTNQIMEMFKKN